MKSKDTKQKKDLYSCIPFLFRSIFYIVSTIFSHGFFIYLIGALIVDNPESIRELPTIELLVFYLLFFILSIFFSCYYFSMYWARIHFTEEGIYWTLFRKEIKRMHWIEVTDCVAFDSYNPFQAFKMIMISKRPLENVDCKRHKSNRIWKRDEVYYVPYRKKILDVLPPEIRPKKLYMMPIPSYEIRKYEK